jgi:hypothetical protein
VRSRPGQQLGGGRRASAGIASGALSVSLLRPVGLFFEAVLSEGFVSARLARPASAASAPASEATARRLDPDGCRNPLINKTSIHQQQALSGASRALTTSDSANSLLASTAGSTASESLVDMETSASSFSKAPGLPPPRRVAARVGVFFFGAFTNDSSQIRPFNKAGGGSASL